MDDILVLVHTVPGLVAEFTQLCAELLPGVALKHILDEPLLERVRQRGRLAPEDCDRLAEHAVLAEAVGARAVLVTCSTVSPCVDSARRRAHIPVVKIDEAMIAEAVRSGPRIGVLATNPTTLEPSRGLLQVQARRAGKPVEIRTHLVEGALAARESGDGGTHDRLVAQAARDLAPTVDVIVLAQASMARALPAIPDVGVPVLASPRLALLEVRDLVHPGSQESP